MGNSYICFKTIFLLSAMCKVKNNKKKGKKVETEELITNFYTIRFSYTQLILNSDLLIRNYSYEFTYENYKDYLMKEMLIVSWCANARKLLEFLQKEKSNFDDDILAIDFFEDEFSIQEYLLQIRSIIAEAKLDLTTLFIDFNKISLHFSYIRDRKLYGIEKPMNGFEWRIEDVFVLITKLLECFIDFIQKQNRFANHTDNLKKYEYTFPSEKPNLILKLSQEEPIIPLIIDKQLFSYLNLFKPLT